MEIRDWEELKKKLCKTEEEMLQRKSFDRADIDVIDKLTNAIKNIVKIMSMETGSSYGNGYGYGNSYGNHDGMWTAEGSYRNGMMPNRDSMGRFSHATDMDDMRMDRRSY